MVQDKLLKKSDMKPFGTMKVCPKCGHNDFEVVYHPDFTSAYSDTIFIPEYMQVTCRFCTYTVEELPLDVKAE